MNNYSNNYDEIKIKELIKDANSGNEQAYDELLSIFDPLVAFIAKKYLSVGVYDDMLQVGRMGLVYAINRFDETRGTKFSSYAYSVITGEILKEVNKYSPIYVPQYFKIFALNVKRVASSLEDKLGHKPSYEEIKDALGDPKATIQEIDLAMTSTLVPISLDYPSNDSNLTIGDMIPDNANNNDAFSQRIENYIKNSGLSEREIFIIQNKFGFNTDNTVYRTKDISKQLGMSESRVMQLYNIAIRKIKKHAKKDGYQIKS